MLEINKKYPNVLGYIAVLTGAVCWALGGASGQYLFLFNAMSADWLVPVRLLIAGLIMLLLAMLRGNKIFCIFRSWKEIGAMLFFAFVGNAGCQYGYYASIQYSNVAFATIIAYTTPVMVLLLTVIMEMRKPTFNEILAISLVCLGTYLISTHGHLDSLSVSAMALGLGLFGAFCYALYIVQSKLLLTRYPLFTVVGWGMTLGSLPMLILFKPWHEDGLIINNMFFVMMTSVIVLGTILSFCLFELGVKKIGSVKASILSAVEPVVSVLVCIVGFGINITAWDIVGMSFILAAIYRSVKK